ncbi:MAG: FAD-binding oxidoreductase [Desulfobacterota bacterium]|nr:FAD-binding oxidoreductase [Thermodesulfobacteriota bacterium]
MASIKGELEKIVGSQNVLTDEPTLKRYAQDQSFVQPRRPDMVVFVENVEQIQKIVRLANATRTPLVPYSSGKNLRGATIPDHGGIILNMSRMNAIIEVDRENLFAVIEPGVTYRQLQDALAPHGLRVMTPFGIVPERSVLTSYLERDPVLAAPSFEDGNALIMDTELVLPNGDLFRTGNWASGGRPGAPNGPIRNTIYRLWTGSQGTLGIMTKMAVQVSFIPADRKIFFIPFEHIADAVEPIRRIQRREIGTECFLLNRFNLAALFAQDWSVPNDIPAPPVRSEDFALLRQHLPPWVLIIVINGPMRRTQEKIAYEAEALQEVCDILNLELREALPHVPGAEQVIADELLRPWGILKKFNFKGSVHDLTFKTPLNNLPNVTEIVTNLALRYGYPESDIGMFVLPLERARALHVEIDLHCPSAECSERTMVKELWLTASGRLVDAGGYFDRPYGAWAPLMYGRAAQYTQMLRKLKAEMDPNNILNPGKLCFA